MMPRNNLLEVLRERGFVDQVTEPEAEVREVLSSPASAYIGFDPTAASLHVGSLVPIMSLVHLQRSGHRPIVLVGGGTGLIGDPSGKMEMRTVMSRREVEGNAASIRRQLERFIDFGGEGALMVNNADWLGPLNYLEFLRDVGRQFSVNRMLAADAYRTRYESQEGLNFLEFNYMLLQAYDYLHLYRTAGCRLQMGGSDQWGNILAGCDLTRRLEGASVYGVTFPLITTASGAKMGKTAAGAVWLDAGLTAPYEYYQFWVNTDDRDVERFLGLFTLLEMEEVRELGRLRGAEIRHAKQRLALEATGLAHGMGEAEKAAEAARELFGTGEASHPSPAAQGEGSSMPATDIAAEEFGKEGIEVFDLFHRVGLAKSRGEARRLIEGGGAYVNGEKVTAFNERVLSRQAREGVITLRAGKKKYHLLRVEEGR
jgi:tyrosyl-tRNA synthetase